MVLTLQTRISHYFSGCIYCNAHRNDDTAYPFFCWRSYTTVYQIWSAKWCRSCSVRRTIVPDPAATRLTGAAWMQPTASSKEKNRGTHPTELAVPMRFRPV